jgi:hypothetical protein
MREQTPYAQWLGTSLGEYRLERFISSTTLGPLFTARNGGTRGAEFLIRILAVPAAHSADMENGYRAHLERQASHITTFRHPYVLPLVSYGLHQGLPYLVWPHAGMRSLTARLAQSGALDVVTAGRYLDQMAAALEYAHERATVHRNLSTDCAYLQLDGQLAIADFGVRRLFELLSNGASVGPYLGSVEACAPEQIQGGRIDAYTDVYALGAVTYRMLTCQPPFMGESVEALIEQQLYAPPPSLAQWRAGLPGALDGVLATALAKDPAQRFQHAGAFADAYHQVVAPANTRRVPFGAPALTPAAAAATAAANLGVRATQRPGAGAIATHGPGRPLTSSASGGSAPPAAPVRWLPASRGGRFIMGGVLLLLVLSGGLFLFASGHGLGAQPSGTVTFFDSISTPTGATDALRITTRGLSAPQSSSRYKAWLVDTQNEQILALGTLQPNASGAYALTYLGDGHDGKPGSNLLGVGDKFEITTESGDVAAPAGQVILSAVFPPQAFVHLKHVLEGFPTTPGQIGLLVGALRQAQVLKDQALALQQTSTAGSPTAVPCRVQSVLDTLEGTHGTHYQPLDPACSGVGNSGIGDGFGLLSSTGGASASSGESYSGAQAATTATGYLALAADHASLAATTPDATENVRAHGGQVETTIVNITAKLTQADADAVKLLKTPTDEATLRDLISLCTQAYGDEGGTPSVQSATGVLAAYQQGQLMATLTLAQPR